ncbi:MAG: hypothetical protein AUI11_08620 [Acidobacteria bacterium 13_2_20CM_2_66_4]|nr:MAG: hypothetical protein AUI11_08620 [Acidobacteria bacterium 13_2_20CM_2_66_4]
MTSVHRRVYIDCARGVAVLLMIEAHTLDAWTRAASRSSIAYRNATILGGFAAPLFLWLAGLAVVLAATRAAARTGNRTRAVAAICRRGLEIFILAFLFRLQAFVVSPGSHSAMILRVDILNVMGPAIVGAGVVWGLAETTIARVAAYAAVAAATAMVTPVVRASAAIDRLPTWVQWYMRPAGEHTTFTLFPWIGFVFAGGAIGALIAAARDEQRERQLLVILTAAGGALVALGLAATARPSIYAASSFWTSSPTWFAIRVGIMMMALGAMYAALKGRATTRGQGRAIFRVARGFSAAIDALARMGRSSLFIYWIHVELVYGYASWLWWRRLPLWGTAIGCAAFSALMFGAVVLKDRLTAAWRARQGGIDRQPAIA